MWNSSVSLALHSMPSTIGPAASPAVLARSGGAVTDDDGWALLANAAHATAAARSREAAVGLTGASASGSDPQRAHPAEEDGVPPLELLVGQLGAGKASPEHLEEHGQLEAAERRAEAVVRPGAEGEMPLVGRTIQPEDVGIGEARGVAVGGGEDDPHVVAGAQGRPGEVDVRLRLLDGEGDDRPPAQALLRGRRRQGGIADQRRVRIPRLEHAEEPDPEAVAGRLVPRGEQEDHV